MKHVSCALFYALSLVVSRQTTHEL